MYKLLTNALEKREKPIDIILVGLGFMGFGFLSNAIKKKNIRIPLVISRQPERAVAMLTEQGIQAVQEDRVDKIKEYAKKNVICVSSNLSLIKDTPSDVVFEVTGTVAYGTKAVLMAIDAKKHVVTMNPELQATVGTELLKRAEKNGVLFTDVAGDQPGSLARLMDYAKNLGFQILLAGNMKRFMNFYATQEQMLPWAKDKGLAVKQTVSFTDGTKQAIEMTLVGNYLGMDILKNGMQGPEVTEIHEVLEKFDLSSFPESGVVDFVIGKSLFPGIFLVAKHTDPNQQKYLRYLGLGEGPYYVLFEPYHLCHLDALQTVLGAVLFGLETINNSKHPRLQTVTLAKSDLKKGTILDGIGGNTIRGEIRKSTESKNTLPVGFAENAVLLTDIPKDTVIQLSDVTLPVNAATKLAGLVQ